MTVPLAAQATSTHLLYVIRNTLINVMVIDKTHLDFTLQLIEGTSVKHLIVLDSDEKDKSIHGISIQSLQSLMKFGQENRIERSDQLCTYSR